MTVLDVSGVSKMSRVCRVILDYSVHANELVRSRGDGGILVWRPRHVS